MCDGETSLEVVPSPKVQAYDAIVPSGSPEPTGVNPQLTSVQVALTLACGSTFGTVAPDAAIIVRPFWVQFTPSIVGPLSPTTVPETTLEPFQSMRRRKPSCV